MCGRFVDPNLRSAGLDTSWLKIDPFASWQQRYNVKPTQEVILVTPDGAPMTARWGLIPSWHKGDLKDWKATTFNARLEEAANKPTFRAVWKYGRCLMPIGGYYEWTGQKGAKQPHYLFSAGNNPTLFCAALASRWGEMLTVTMMTRSANADVSGIHHRMPVMLNINEREAWLSGSNDVSDLGQEVRIHHHAVGRFGFKDDGPDLIDQLDAPEPHE